MTSHDTRTEDRPTAGAPARRRAGSATPRTPLWRSVFSWVMCVVGGVFVLGYGAAFAVPQALGGQGLTILTGSMVPTYNPGDVVAVRPVAPEDACTTIALGDVVTFMPYANDPTLVTHRVVGVSAGSFDGWDCQFLTQGDANSALDAPVLPLQIRARVMYSVPYVGFVWQWGVQNRELVLGAVGVGVALWIGVDPVMNALARRHARRSDDGVTAVVARVHAASGAREEAGREATA